MDQLCRLLEISRSSYYAWLHRGISPRKQQDQQLSRQLITLHQQQPASGLDTLFHMIRRKMVCSRKRIYRLMRQLHIQSARKFAYKRTTNSRHSHPVAANLLNRNFQVSNPNTVWVGDITYIPTGQGWLYQGRHHAKPACRLCAASADEFSVISHKNYLKYHSIPASFLCNLTKNLLAHLPHNLCVVSPCNCKRPLHQEGGGLCVFQPHRYGADPGGTPHGCKTGASGAGADVSFGSGRAVCGSGVPGRARKTGLCAKHVPEG